MPIYLVSNTPLRRVVTHTLTLSRISLALDLVSTTRGLCKTKGQRSETMATNTPIAVIGMSCRFAGDVDSPEKLWNLLAEGQSAWSEIPKDRFNVEGFHHPNFEKLNGVSTKMRIFFRSL